MPTYERAVSHVGLGKQTALATPVAASLYIPRVSVEETLDPARIPNEGAYGHLGTRLPYEGLRRVTLSLVFDARPRELCHLLRSLCGPPTSTQPNAGGAPNTWDHVFKFPRQAPFLGTTAGLWWPNPYTIEWFRDVQALSKQFADVGANTLQLALEEAGKLAITAGLIGRDFPINLTKTTPTFPTLNPWLFHQRTQQINAGSYTEIGPLTLALDAEYQGNPIGDGTKVIGEIATNGRGVATVSGTSRILSLAEKDAFEAGTTRNLVVTFVGETIESTFKHTLTLAMPLVLYTRYNVQDQGAGRFTAEWEGGVHYSPSDGYAVQITVRTNVINTELA